jgi:hypothetical protein
MESVPIESLPATNESVKKPRKPRVPKAEKEPKTKKEPKSKKEQKEKEEDELCSICADRYTPILRKKIVCKFCEKDTCCKCIEQYLLNRHEDAHCLHCRVNYSDIVLREICTKTYLQQVYFKHRQEVLINRERIQLPPLQDAAIRSRALRDGYRQLKTIASSKKLAEAEVRRENYQVYLAAAALRQEGLTPEEHQKLQTRLEETMKRGRDASERRNTLKSEGQALRLRLWRIRMNRNPETGLRQDNTQDSAEEKEEKKKFIRRCVRANCTGFLSTAWKCGICDWYSCSKCFNVRGEHHDTPHECTKEDLETAELIRSNSKPCPKCGEFIEKSSGCNQMYCISCHTPWDWVTGKIVTHGVIHNPHYYEWLKRTGGTVQRNPADVPCGGYPDAWELVTFSKQMRKDLTQYWIEFYRICMEIQDQSQRNYRSHLDQQSTQNIHINYLLGDYTDARWGQLLAINEKKKKRDTEIQDVFNAFRMVAVELINRIQNYRENGRPSFAYVPLAEATTYLEGVVNEMRALVQMINDAFKGISISHCYSVPYIQFNESYTTDHRSMMSLVTRNWSTTKHRSKKADEEEKESDDSLIPVANDTAQDEFDEKEREEEPDELLREGPPSDPEDEDDIVQLQQVIAESLRRSAP